MPQKTKGGGMEREPGEGGTERQLAKANPLGSFQSCEPINFLPCSAPMEPSFLLLALQAL